MPASHFFPTLPLLAATEMPPVSGAGMLSLFLWAIAAVLLTWYVGGRAIEMQYTTLADGTQLVRKLPLSFRLLLPFCSNIRMFSAPRFEHARQDTRTRLVSAGYDIVISPENFMALRLLCPLVMAPVVIGLLALLFSQLPGGMREFVQTRQGILFLLVFCYLVVRPTMWLKATIRARHREIERGLPFILDLLTLSVEAGLDFMTAIRRLIERRKMDALNEEFIRAVREMQVGRTRKDALRDMAERVQQPDLTSVVSSLIQADELGVGIGTILRVQADQMRVRRFQRAEKLANEAPIKLLFPLVCFIFPCVFLVLLGPIFLELIAKGF